MEVILFGKEVFADVIKFKDCEIRRSSWIRPGWALNPTISVFIGTHKRRSPCENEGRDWNDASTS